MGTTATKPQTAETETAAETTSQYLQCNTIDWPTPAKEDRSRDKNAAESLALSIELEGMHHPIVVIPHPTKQGRYLGVMGWHRWTAVSVFLKRPLIEAKVRVDMDEDLVSMARISENLNRNPLTKNQASVAMRKWQDLYARKKQEYDTAVDTKRAAKKAAREAKAKPPVAEEPANRVQIGPDSEAVIAVLPVEPEPAVDPESIVIPPKPPKGFVEHAAAVTGESKTSVKRKLAIGKAFTEDQANVLDQMEVNQVWTETIAKLPQGQRDAIVNLIATGMEPAQAVSEIQGQDQVVRIDGKVIPTSKVEEAASEIKAEDDLADRDWLDTYCGDLLKILPHKAKFEADAILYRKLREERYKFSLKAAKPLLATAKAGAKGPFYFLVNRFANIAHPKHWLICGKCKGHGANDGQGCNDCMTAGYVTRKEGE